MASCPEWDEEIEVDEFDVDKGDQLSCPECGSNLEETGLAPLELDIAPDDDEEEADDDVEEVLGDGDDDAAEEEDDEDDDDEDVEERSPGTLEIVPNEREGTGPEGDALLPGVRRRRL